MGNDDGELIQGARPATILVVEDEPILCEVLHGWLEEKGYRVFSANSGLAEFTLPARHGYISDGRLKGSPRAAPEGSSMAGPATAWLRGE